MATKTQNQLHVFFFPFMAQGHLIPAIDMAKLFALRGQRSTIITTPYFTPFLTKSLEKNRNLHTPVDILTIKIPSSEAGFPKGIESLDMAPTPQVQGKFFEASGLFEPQIDELLELYRPDCLVADIFFPWATDVAAKYGIPRLIFHGSSNFAMCCNLSVFRSKPYKHVSSEYEPFIIPNLPDKIEFTASRVADFIKEDSETETDHFTKMYKVMKEVELRSYGILVNSFYELEPAYADHYPKVIQGIKTWQIGPLFLYDKGLNLEEHDCLKWLHCKKPNSVIYVSFGSVANFNDEQLMEIATGLEASGQQFIWVVRREKKEGVSEEWLPEGFEERMEGKGVIVRGWAPQIPILEHEAIGGFLTHCGWNSTLESICAGVPMVTWPVSAEQFCNEKLVSEILRVGIEVGAKKWKVLVGDFVKRDAIERAVTRLMKGDEAEEMRSRVKELADKARNAILDGGSSVLDLDALFHDLKNASATRKE